ncbi:hypothetical protein KUCAC02_024388 [Chaenocephalus aceratus]|uniref:Uncharacterized protein n=1 Tax=Chaenocephalus aceratus TaxID=36190 RepID=A0ACB9WIE0_CHAAC|nr:hypothetical protein KUCAC02_024388 [Chaenocephalus aceratus]
MCYILLTVGGVSHPSRPEAQISCWRHSDSSTAAIMQLIRLEAAIILVQNGAESCLDQMKVCINDAVCNKYLIPVSQACMAPQCDHDRCEKASQQFYSSMPHDVAEIIVMLSAIRFCNCSTVGVVVLVPLAVVSKIWMLRRRDKTKFHHPEKSNCAVNP